MSIGFWLLQSLNALALGCNQKTTRDVVMNLSDAVVLAALAVRTLVPRSIGRR